ncbi:transposase [Sorangium sp. So ce1128]
MDPEIGGAKPRWVSFEQRTYYEAMIARSSYPDVPAWGAFSSLEVLVQAAREGLGMAMLPTYVGEREPELRRLARPDLRHVADLWLLSHPDLRDNARFRAIRASVAQALKVHAPLFRGEGWRTRAPGCPEIRAGDRAGLERLCRYGARPPFSLERISLLPDGRVAYRLRKPRRNGATHLVLAPVHFLARIAALVPPPRYPLLRLSGVLASGSSWRAAVVAHRPAATGIPVPETKTKTKTSAQQDLGRLPAGTRYQEAKDALGGLSVEVMFHSHLSHAAQELKRLLCAADAMRRAFDLGYLSGGEALSTPRGQRCAMLLTMAGLLEFPADQNFIDGLWSMALKALRLPQISRSTVRACITDEDHEISNYYGSRRGLGQLLAALEKSDPVTFEQLGTDDPRVGRLAELDLGAGERPVG